MWEKFSDYSLDVSKYFVTAMLVTALLGDIGEMRWLIYAISLGVGGLFFWAGIFFDRKARKERREKQNKYIRNNNKRRRT